MTRNPNVPKGVRILEEYTCLGGEITYTIYEQGGKKWKVGDWKWDRPVEIIEEEKEEKMKMLNYSHSCKGESRKHLVYKAHWAQIVEKVRGTYPWVIGKMLEVDKEYQVPEGSIIIEVCDGYAVAIRLTELGKEVIADGSYDLDMEYIVSEIARVKGLEQ